MLELAIMDQPYNKIDTTYFIYISINKYNTKQSRYSLG